MKELFDSEEGSSCLNFSCKFAQSERTFVYLAYNSSFSFIINPLDESVIEFETELVNNTINIPENFQLELSLSKDNHVRVIVLIDDVENSEETDFKKMLHNQFLKGYDEADAVYDDL